MTVAPKAAFGTQLKIGDGGGPESFTVIQGVRNLGGPEYSLETIDVTHHTSSGNYRQVVPSFLTAGQINFDLLYDSNDAQHAQLISDYAARTVRNFKVIFTDTGVQTHSFAAYVSNFSLAAPIDDALTASVSLSITGAVTRSVSSPSSSASASPSASPSAS